jgi:hypothetical protein
MSLLGGCVLIPLDDQLGQLNPRVNLGQGDVID